MRFEVAPDFRSGILLSTVLGLLFTVYGLRSLREPGREVVVYRQAAGRLFEEMHHEVCQHENWKQHDRLFLHCIYYHTFCAHGKNPPRRTIGKQAGGKSLHAPLPPVEFELTA